MAGNIKGITIEIAGDTTKLGKALASANKEIKNAQSNLKSVEKALKLDPTNVEMLKAKQNALNDVIKETKEKLDMEKEAAEQAKQALDTGEISQSEYDALQAEIVQTTKNLEELEKQAKQSASVLGSQMQAAGDKIQAVGDKIGNVGESMTKNVTAPIAAVGGASLVAFNEVDKGLDTVIEKTGATGEELEQMQQMVKDISTEIPTDFATAGEAVGEVNTRFGVTGDELEDLSEKFIKFASLNKKDVTSSVDSVQKSLSAFGLGVDHTDELLDTLNATAQKTGVDVDSLTAGLIQNGTAFQEMGLSIEQSVALMGQMEKSGANSETVMQGLRKALKNATEEGIPLNQALSDLQDTIRNGTNDMDGLTAAYDLFGKSGDQIYGAVKNGTLDFEALADSINDNLGSVEGTYANTLDGMDDMKVSMNALKVAGAELGSSIASTVAPMFQKLSAILKNVAQWWDNLNPKTQEAIVKIAMVAAAIGPLLLVIKKLFGGISTILSVGGSLVTFISGSVVPAITGVGTTITGTIIPAISSAILPISAVIGVITALIIAIKNWDSIVELAKIAWDALKNAVLNAWESIKQKWDEAVEFFQGIWDNISQSADFLVQSVIGFFTSCWENIQEAWSTVVEFFQGIWDSLQAAADLLVQTVTGFFTTAWDNIRLVWDEVTGFFQGVWDGITGVFSSVGSWFSEKFSEGYNNITSLFSGLAGFFSGVWDDITGIFKEIGTTISDAITGSVKSAVNTVLGGAVKIINGFIKAINTAISVINAVPGVHISKITELSAPQLERGGILAKGQVGILEGNGAEAVVPLDQNKKWVNAVAKSFAEELGNQKALAGAGGTGDIYITVQLGTEEIKKILIKQEQINNRRSGGR